MGKVTQFKMTVAVLLYRKLITKYTLCSLLFKAEIIRNLPIAVSKHITSIESFRLATSIDKSTNQGSTAEWFEF